ncbi:hypothetical protein E5288_WYG008504 [Bos mutus]|uniref:Uncharacterized protein n=1 Tax=Bos mutus TaxID=72004 RepID=A0A6B0RW08_9CETA|nr:hypothetical protein [Bos mutus]
MVCHSPGISVPTEVAPIGKPPDGRAAGFRGAEGIGVRRAPSQASDGPDAELETQEPLVLVASALLPEATSWEEALCSSLTSGNGRPSSQSCGHSSWPDEHCPERGAKAQVMKGPVGPHGSQGPSVKLRL